MRPFPSLLDSGTTTHILSAVVLGLALSSGEVVEPAPAPNRPALSSPRCGRQQNKGKVALKQCQFCGKGNARTHWAGEWAHKKCLPKIPVLKPVKEKK